MSATAKIRPKIIQYENEHFTIRMPENWIVSRVSGDQLLFIGPKVGQANLGIYVTRVAKKNNSLKKVVANAKTKQSKLPHYKLISEKDLSKDSFSAFMRRSTWYQKKIDTMLFVREIFMTARKKDIIVMSCSIPNSPMLTRLNNSTLAPHYLRRSMQYAAMLCAPYD